MIYERLDRGLLSVDTKELERHIQEYVLPLEPMLNGSYFGGWGVLTSTGDYADGFHRGQLAYDPSFHPGKSIEEKRQILGLNKRNYEFRVPTQICHGYLLEVVNQIRSLGLEPSRVRLSLLKAHGQSTRHRDANPGNFLTRLHIPIITNPYCTFECDEGVAHMPADGSAYILDVVKEHQVFNRGDTDRIILLADVADRPWLTKYHRLPQSR